VESSRHWHSALDLCSEEFIFYVEVEDVQEYPDHAVGLGEKMLVAPVEIPNGIFMWFSVPKGNTPGLWKAKE